MDNFSTNNIVKDATRLKAASTKMKRRIINIMGIMKVKKKVTVMKMKMMSSLSKLFIGKCRIVIKKLLKMTLKRKRRL